MHSQEFTPQILKRFSGAGGEQRGVEALASQKLVQGSIDAAKTIWSAGEVRCFQPGEFITVEGDWSNEVVFILAGSAQVLITGFRVAERQAGQHIGEMALIDPSAPRSASVVALEPTVGLTLTEASFASIADQYPFMWKLLAKEVAERLRERRKFIRPTNPVPFLFIACASESIHIAEAFRCELESSEVVVELWTDGVFKPSQSTMESLEAKLSSADFAVAIFSADDRIESRGRQQIGPRDNTVFELGLFAGALGRERSFFAVEKDAKVKIPSDLAGINSLRYRSKLEDKKKADIEDACSQIEERISVLGPR